MARDLIQLPADSTGKAHLAFTETEAGTPAPNAGVRYMEGFVLCDSTGRVMETVPGVAPPSTGLLTMGSDYGGTPLARTIKVNANGEVAVNSSPRTLVSIGPAPDVATVTAEALISAAAVRANAAIAAATAFTVTPGKTFRLQSFTGWLMQNSTTAIVAAYLRLRASFTASGAVTATSPTYATLHLGMPSGGTEMFLEMQLVPLTFADGLEFPGGTSIGVTQLATAATGLIGYSLTGYEY